jgi:PIN domain nuclease of toxin-antitoxin system
MRDLSEIGLDSQCLTYLISTLEGVASPTDNLAEQKVALVRLYLYTPGTVWVTPTVQREFLRIRDEAHRTSHVNWTSVLFGVRPLNSAAAVERRAASLEAFHADPDDRLVLAESEDIGFATLLSCDTRFVNRLSKQARLALTQPAACWASLGIPKGATPDKVPGFGNPLAAETWWRW